MPKRVVVIFGYDGAQLIDIAGPTQALTTANEEGASPPYAVRLAAVSRGPIRTVSSMQLIADALPRAVTIDTLLIPGGPGVPAFEKFAGLGCAPPPLRALETHLRGLHRRFRIGANWSAQQPPRRHALARVRATGGGVSCYLR